MANYKKSIIFRNLDISTPKRGLYKFIIIRHVRTCYVKTTVRKRLGASPTLTCPFLFIQFMPIDGGESNHYDSLALVVGDLINRVLLSSLSVASPVAVL